MNADWRSSIPAEAEALIQGYRQRVQELEARLEESEETLDAIRRGDIDAGRLLRGKNIYINSGTSITRTSISRIFDNSKEYLGPCLTIYDVCDKFPR